ncbi:uncharacterized protein BCR38DRAFT_168374 [Pseudomassariella vexata]|uniref:SAM and PH domain-containing protein n=1 Tax=Pseudomassariella vexata TaxID=1141098 RepID=A0A1Y2E2W4_9PEZI|nr:uncharacterized protein BCR38DRAFT_168374 [Pseudomassariella vexata]ORY65890.1 hypothetical protein BCR38DRAFT_168374 [Pseudomassariella vexata]
MNTTRSLRVSERSHEMSQKTHMHDSFFGLKCTGLRPSSVATEIVDTDWDQDEDDIISDIEDDESNSPRISLNSSSGGQRSVTTLSSYEEAHTPRSSRTRAAYPFDYDPSKPVEGPRGPHLFRTSSHSAEFEQALSLSPITPKAPALSEGDFRFYISHEPLPTHYEPLPTRRGRQRDSGPFQFSNAELESRELVSWSPEMVAQWMLNAGVEVQVAEKFVENDINGAIIITLKSEDLKELHIQSFGVRMQVWSHICNLRDIRPESPRPETPIEDEEDKEVRRERRRMEEQEEQDHKPKRCQSKRKPCHEDIISPLESVSIVGIEQVMPKPHHCSKGENCSKWRRQQRMIEAFKKDHPFVDEGGVIMVAGDPGNAASAPALNRPSSTEVLRPFSDAVPSVVASSDVLGPGPGISPFQYLQEATLRSVQQRDPQDNVKQFLDFQHQHVAAGSSDVPPTPPFEMHPSAAPAHEGLRALPKLSIPGKQAAKKTSMHAPSKSSNLSREFTPYRMSKAEPLADDLATPVGPYRFGTPFSEMDVPVTAIDLGPVARDASQSVPPDMGYRAPAVPVRSLSRASKRPSFQVMAPLDENAATPLVHKKPQPLNLSHLSTPKSPPRVPSRAGQQPLQAPPRAQYPWSAQPQRTAFERTLPVGEPLDGTIKDAEGIAYQGPVRKRKTRMLRHEWHDHYATLKGTRLAIHKDAASREERTLEYIDVDDYAIACSSLASSKLNAAFKAMSISRGNKDNKDVAAFSFQLIPQGKEGLLGARLRKRESSLGSALLTAGPEGVNGTGKTHHFAVRSRDERIDWMRELMLAKALKQKGEGFEVSVNGNMI